MESRGSRRLAAFMDRRDLSPAGFGKLIGANRSYVYRLCRGQRAPGVEMAFSIARATKGSVRVGDWTKPPLVRRMPRGPSQRAAQGT